MKIREIDCIETWYTDKQEKTVMHLTVEFSGDDPSFDKIVKARDKKHSIYVHTDRELDEIYLKQVEKPDDYKKIDYLVEKLNEVLGSKARKKDKN